MRKKQLKVRPVDMCIYIDNNIYKPDHDVQKIFEYLQDLYFVLAMKKRYFGKDKDYEDYSIYSASQTYMRLTNSKQHLPDSDPRKIPQIKSILNYIKRIMYPLKVNYEQHNYKSFYSEEIDGVEVMQNLDYELKNDVLKLDNGLIKVDVTEYISKICSSIKQVIDDTPYWNNKEMYSKLYLSCLISTLNMITLNNHDHNKLFTSEHLLKSNAEDMTQSMLEKEMLNCPICWHIDESLKDYIYVLTMRIKKKIVSDINEIVRSYQPSEDILSDIILSPLAQEHNDD